MISQQVITKHNVWPCIGILDVIAERRSRNFRVRNGIPLQGNKQNKRSQRCFYFLKKEIKLFPKTTLGKGEPSATKFIIQSENCSRCFGERKEKDCQQNSGKLEGDKVFTCFHNIKHVQKKYIITSTFGTENSPCIIFFKLCVNM